MEKAIKAQIEAFAIMAEIEGMKAENSERLSDGYALAYDNAAFLERAEQLRHIAAMM